MRVETAARLLAAAGVRWVRFEIADLRGVARSKSVPLPRFPIYGARGVGYYSDMPRIEGMESQLGAGEVFQPRDVLLLPDLDTLAVLPYAPGDARVICDVLRLDQEAAEDDPRYVLRRIVDRYLDEGLMPFSGFSQQFYLLDGSTNSPEFPLGDPCAGVHDNRFPEWCDALLGSLPALGLELASFGAGEGPGQLAVACEPARGAVAADQSFSLRSAARETADQLDLTTTFMTQPFIDQPGSGLKLRHGLCDAATGRDLFHDADDPFELSLTAKHFLSGLLYHAPALTALLRPTPNGFKRNGSAHRRRQTVTWGFDNRTTAIRVDRTRPEPGIGAGRASMVDGRPARVVSQFAGSDANPYIALAGSLAAGLDGIERRLLPPEPITGDVREARGVATLPDTLDAALAALEADNPLRDALGEPFIRYYLFVKRFDIARIRLACPDYGSAAWAERVDPFELSEYGDPS